MSSAMPDDWRASGWMPVDECEDLTIPPVLALAFRRFRDPSDPVRAQVAVCTHWTTEDQFRPFRTALRVYSVPSVLVRAAALAPFYGWPALRVLASGGRGAVEAALAALTPEG